MQLVKDFLLERYVIIAPGRSARPKDVKVPRVKKDKKCPFCPGNEAMTPPAVKEIKKGKTWEIRIIPNKFPFVEGHEVIIESSNHSSRLYDENIERIKKVIELYIERVKELEKKYGYVQIFRNYGHDGGASLTHPHTQITPLKEIPELVKEEITANEKYIKEKNICAFCDMIKKEGKIWENSSFSIISPQAPRFSYESWIIPKRHFSTIKELNEKEIGDLAEALQRILKNMDKKLGNPSYNYILHQAENKNYHMHFEVLPVTSKIAGFEKATGIYVNSVPPEETIKTLK